MAPQLARFTDLALLLLRIIVALVLTDSGYSDLKAPTARSKSIEQSKPFTIFIGIAEMAGGLGIAFGVLTQFAAIGLILLMMGAIYKKIFSWHIGFWGDKTYGWHYELMLILMLVVIACTDGGHYVLLNTASYPKIIGSVRITTCLRSLSRSSVNRT